MRYFIKHVAILLILAVTGLEARPARAAERPPNFLVILCDNLGYGDIGCFGSTKHRTPHVDRLAREGMRFTDFYSSSGVCTPSRASLMTGCYPRRVNMHVSDRGASVLQPVARKGLHPDEVTIAEVLKKRGYTAALLGKWHLGDQPAFLPTRQGFDFYLGIPYSDDMTPRPNQNWPELPLMRQEKVIEAPVDRNLLTKRYTEEAIRLITANRDKPFFVLLSHAMPGSTRTPYASEPFRGKSANGPWGDSVEEIDWSTGELLRTLKELDLDRQTLVIWTSDNGAPRRDPPQGSNLPLAGWGYTTAEGGQRIPCAMRWPGKIPAGKDCNELATLMDLLPTLAHLAGADLPTDRTLDGKDITPLMFARPGAKSPHEAFYYYHMDQLQAVRSGPWKLYLPLEKRRAGSRIVESDVPARLYNLREDLGERKEVSKAHPEVVSRLEALAQRAREDLGDLDQPGKNQRPAGDAPRPTPRELEK